MTKIYKIYEDFEVEFALATKTGVIELANNICEHIGTFTDLHFTDFEKARKFIEEDTGLNIIELDDVAILEIFENITTIVDIGNGYIQLA